MPTSFRNGLHVVEDNTTFASVDAELYAIDQQLFLTWDVDQGRKLYRVMFDRGDKPPAEIARWVNERNEPLPLSHGLVDRVKALRPRDGKIDFEAGRKANEAREARAVADFEEEVDAIAADMGPRIAGKKRSVLHRGQHLRQARSRTGHHGRDQTA